MDVEDVPYHPIGYLEGLAMEVLFSAVFLLISPSLARSSAPTEKLVTALIQVESGGDDNAIGDKNLRNKAYGCLQVRQPCVDDVNRVYGTDHRAEDCLGDRDLSIWIFERYMDIYATERRLGRKPTDEDCARIWNGGPSGWKKESTLKYWVKVKKVLSSLN